MENSEDDALGALEALIVDLEAAQAGGQHLDDRVYWFLKNGVGVGLNGTGPAFTTSIDAAMTAVPEGWFWSVFNRDQVMLRPVDMKAFGCTLAAPETTGGPEPWTVDRAVVDVEAPTPALALCIAALKARAME